MAKTILLADDSATIRKVVELTLSDTGYHVESVGTGSEALDVLERARPDLVLADVVMPEPAGYEICRRVKASDHPVPVLLLAGTFEAFDAQRAQECGADGHLVKPFESDVLLDHVRRLLERGEPEEAAQTGASRGDVKSSSGRASDGVPADGGPAVLEPGAIEAIARQVVGYLSQDVLRDVAREVLPQVAERVVRQRIRELEREDHNED